MKRFQITSDLSIEGTSSTASSLRCFRRSSGYPSPSLCTCTSRSSLSGSDELLRETRKIGQVLVAALCAIFLWLDYSIVMSNIKIEFSVDKDVFMSYHNHRISCGI